MGFNQIQVRNIRGIGSAIGRAQMEYISNTAKHRKCVDIFSPIQYNRAKNVESNCVQQQKILKKRENNQPNKNTTQKLHIENKNVIRIKKIEMATATATAARYLRYTQH